MELTQVVAHQRPVVGGRRPSTHSIEDNDPVHDVAAIFRRDDPCRREACLANVAEEVEFPAQRGLRATAHPDDHVFAVERCEEHVVHHTTRRPFSDGDVTPEREPVGKKGGHGAGGRGAGLPGL